MADWSLPALTSTYTNFATEVKNRDVDLALQFDGTTSTNLTTGTIRWNSSANTWQKWSGSAWGALSSTFAFPVIATTGAVGVGTTPTTTLDVAGGMVRNGSASGNNLIQAYSNSGSVGLGMWSGGSTRFYSTGNMTFSVNATIGTGIPTGYTDAVTITGSGQVGIGTNNPTNQSTTQVTSDNDGIRVQLSATPVGGQGPRLIFGHNTNNGTQQVFAAIKSLMQGGNDVTWGSDLAFYTGGSSLAERVRIDSSGRVGIGTTSPVEKLEVQNGSISIGQSSNTSQTNVLVAGYGFVLSGTKYGNTSIRSTYENAGNTASLEFYTTSGPTSTAERLRIDSSGRVGIATTSPAVTLDVNAVDAVRIASGTTAQRPTGAAGMIRYNSSLSQFEGYGTAWGTIGGGAKGSGSDQVFFENDQTVTSSYTLTANKNAMTAGPVTVNSGVTVTIPSGSFWSIV